MRLCQGTIQGQINIFLSFPLTQVEYFFIFSVEKQLFMVSDFSAIFSGKAKFLFTLCKRILFRRHMAESAILEIFSDYV